MLCSVIQPCPPLCRLQPTRLLCPWDSPGKNTGVGCRALLQGIVPTQDLNPGLPHCRRILYSLSHQRNLRILEWVAYPFFLPQELNWGVLHCRWILYQPSYQGSPKGSIWTNNSCITYTYHWSWGSWFFSILTLSLFGSWLYGRNTWDLVTKSDPPECHSATAFLHFSCPVSLICLFSPRSSFPSPSLYRPHSQLFNFLFPHPLSSLFHNILQCSLWCCHPSSCTKSIFPATECNTQYFPLKILIWFSFANFWSAEEWVRVKETLMVTECVLI